ncbi:MAG: hypothetical protein IME95_02740 [Proteobacteria bacterium]|jgi:hypothetical protein|nr:hypothetical protein [Pseudomonadota bacterium]
MLASLTIAVDLAVGDVVRLKRGAPLVTIEEVDEYLDNDRKDAVYTRFEGKQRMNEIHELSRLEEASGGPAFVHLDDP